MKLRPVDVLLLIAFAGCTLLRADPGSPTIPATAPASRSAATNRADAYRAEINRIMEFFRITQPDVYEQAKVLRTQDPERFERLIMGAAYTVNRLEAIKRRNSHLFDLSMQDMTLNYQSFRIAHELKRTDLPDADRAQLRKQLADIVSSEFDIQQQIRQIEIEEQKQKLEDLDSQIKMRQDNKDQIIDKRIDDLIQRPPRLDWQ